MTAPKMSTFPVRWARRACLWTYIITFWEMQNLCLYKLRCFITCASDSMALMAQKLLHFSKTTACQKLSVYFALGNVPFTLLENSRICKAWVDSDFKSNFWMIDIKSIGTDWKWLIWNILGGQVVTNWWLTQWTMGVRSSASDSGEYFKLKFSFCLCLSLFLLQRTKNIFNHDPETK